MNKIKREANEELRFYALRISKLVKKAYPNNQVSPEAANRLKIDFSLRCLNPELAQKLSVRKPTTVQETVEMAEIYETEVLSSSKNKRKEASLALIGAPGWEKEEILESCPKEISQPNRDFFRRVLSRLWRRISGAFRRENGSSEGNPN